MSRHNHSTVFIHDERFSFNGAKISRIQRAYKIKTITSEIDLMTLGKDTQQTCSCCQASLVGLFVDSRQQCKCCGGVVCEECNSNPAVIQGQEFRGEKSVCDSCFAEKTQHRQYGYTVKPPTRGGSVDDERSAQLQKGRKIRVVHPVGLVTDPSVDNCMGCDAQFGWTVFKHHCRCCGNVMCSVSLLATVSTAPTVSSNYCSRPPQDCLPHCVKINELHSSAQKTCKFCYNEETISKETTVVLGDEEIQVRRVHVGTKADGTRGHVGWVLDECSDKCMGCTQKFSARRHKMHCRSCGDLVCQVRLH